MVTKWYMAYKKKDKKTPTDLNGMLTTATIIGRWPDFDKQSLNRPAISHHLSFYLDRVDVEIQNILYKVMGKVHKEGMIIICEHSVKTKNVLYRCELYLGRPSPVVSQIFKEQVNNIDPDGILTKFENKYKDKKEEENGELCSGLQEPNQED